MSLKTMLITGTLVASLGTTTAAYATSHHTMNLDNKTSTDTQQQVHMHHSGFGHFHQMRAHGVLSDVATILKTDKQTLIKDLKSGNSLADIAKAKGISEQDLVSKLNADLKTRLDKAVADGKLSADKEQAILKNSQARLTKLVEKKGLGKIAFRHGHRMGLLNDAATILKTDKKTLISELQSGKSLADIAKAKGISEQELVSKLNSDLKTRLDKAVANGKLSADKEQAILKNSQSFLTKLVEKKGFGKMHGPKGHMLGMGLFKDAASILNVDQKTLINDLKSGKSLADLASSKGISKQELVSKLSSDMKTRLDKAVANGKLTAAQEQKILSDATTHLNQFVDQKGFGRDDHMGQDQNEAPAPTQSTYQ